MKTLEEKIKEIRDLSKNLNESKIKQVCLDLKGNFIIRLHWVAGVELFKLTYANDYDKLI